MLDLAKFKKHLVDSGAVDKSQLDRAQKHAAEQNISLSESLLTLNILSHRGLGKCFSELYDLPYVTIQGKPPNAEARSQISSKCAIRWKVFPVSYTPEEHILALAIHDPDQIPRIEKVYRFFMQPHAIGFVISSKAEMDRAFETYYGVVRPKIVRDAEDKLRAADKKARLSGLHKHADARDAPATGGAAGAPAPEPLPSGEGSIEASPPSLDVATAAAPQPAAPAPAAPSVPHLAQKAPADPAQKPPPDSAKAVGSSALRRALAVKPAGETPGTAPGASKPWSRYNRGASDAVAAQNLPYTEMSRALLSAVALLVRAHLENDSMRTMMARARTRYCQLLAGRLAFTPAQSDSTILAAWLSMIQDKPDVVSQLGTP